MTCSLNSRIFFESSESPVTVSFEYEAEVLLSVDREQVIYIYIVKLYFDITFLRILSWKDG